jgi:tetratricopeptide (TPR) repeat protein
VNLGWIRYYLASGISRGGFRKSLPDRARIPAIAQGEAAALMALGRLSRRRRQLEKAEEGFRRAMTLADQVGAERESALAREFLAEVELDRGNPSAALALLYPALELAQKRAPEGDVVGELETRIGLALLQMGKVDDGRTHALRGAILAESWAISSSRRSPSARWRGSRPCEGTTSGLESHIRTAAQGLRAPERDLRAGGHAHPWGEMLLLHAFGLRAQIDLEPVG